jgi:predicted nucleic acid-binding protein
MPRYLADTSAWSVARRKKAPIELRESFGALLLNGEIAMCGAVQWELLHSVNSAEEYSARRQDLDALDQVAFNDSDWQRVFDVSLMLAEQGGTLHRAPKLPDAIVAVAAERSGLTVLHYDKDFDLIARVTGQSCEWIAPRGSL